MSVPVLRFCVCLWMVALLSACPQQKPAKSSCQPTSCAQRGFNCGSTDDGCGTTLSCGLCAQDEICGAEQPNVCAPATCNPESDTELCTALGYECGDTTTTDDCGQQRTVNCGACTGNNVCGSHSPHRCGDSCIPEADAAICARLGKDCGTIETSDDCSQLRQVQCGSCQPPNTCGSNGVANVCAQACQAESDSETCTRLGKDCGDMSAHNNCGETREINCGVCTGNNVCGGGGMDNLCGSSTQCESDAELCARLGHACGYAVAIDSCGQPRTPHCGVCPAPEMCDGDGIANQCGSSYPYRDVWNMKGIQPDGWSRDDLQANGIHGVPANLLWAHWEPQVRHAPCSGGEIEYHGRCYTISDRNDAYIREWSNRGVLVTGVIFGVPSWASAARAPHCGEDAWGNGWFWAPDDDKVADLARYAGMMADRYDGTKGHGRIADFVVLNEVNAAIWFDAGRNHPNFSQEMWIDAYADNYIAAYDAIVAEQPAARVLMSFTHHYDERHDLPFHSALPRLSSQSMIRGVAARAGDRKWRVAFHPYPPAPLPEFDAKDLHNWGISTYGTVGALVGWLRAEFPDRPHAWEVQLTENGVASGPNHSVDGDNPAVRIEKQRIKVCEALRNVVATPWTGNHIYHRMVDHHMEQNFKVGLAWGVNDPKPAWNVYRLANLQGSLGCGYEDLPYIRLHQGTVRTGLGDIGLGYWTSSRALPHDYERQPHSGWRLLRDWEPGTQMLFECATGDDTNMITADPLCEGEIPMGPVGHAWLEPPQGSVPLYRCYKENFVVSSHFVSTDVQCEGETQQAFLGYAMSP